jgi:DNA invertase Pin-like site-specific DNA recombinase
MAALRAIIYTRTATREQAAGLGRQRARARGHCERHGHEVVGEYSEQGQDDREFGRLLAEAARPGRAFDAVAVADVARLGRDPAAVEARLAALRGYGVRVLGLTPESDEAGEDDPPEPDAVVEGE